MKVLVCIGSVYTSKLPKHTVGIHCDDYEDLLDYLQDIDDDYEHIVVIGNNVFKKAFWNEYGCYGDIMNSDDVVSGVNGVFSGEVVIQ